MSLLTKIIQASKILMGEKNKYPNTVKEVLDDSIVYPDKINEIMQSFAQSKPYKGTLQEMRNKFRTLNSNLAKACSIPVPQLVFFSYLRHGGCYIKLSNRHAIIVLHEEKHHKYSVVTFLHEFGHALGFNEKETCRWSINLFRKHFPKAYSKLGHKKHLLVKQKNNDKKI